LQDSRGEHHVWPDAVTELSDCGEITKKQGVDEIKLGRHGGVRRSDQEQDRNPILLGKGRDYDLARLDIVARVRSSEISANAAAIDVGSSRKLSPFEQVVRLIPKLIPEERRC
jgi:hypothetical protein